MQKTHSEALAKLSRSLKGKGTHFQFIAMGVVLAISSGTQAGQLHQAIEVGNIDSVEQMLKAGANVDQTNACDLTPLQIAVGKNSPLLVGWLLDAGAEINAVDASREATALHLASYLGDVGTIEVLIVAGANVDQQDAHGHTPLIRAVYGGHKAAVRMLLSAGADATIVDYFNQASALAIANKIGRLEIIDELKGYVGES